MGYGVGIGLSLILIGLPLLLFTLAGTRTLAAMDRKLNAAILGIEDEPDTWDDVEPRYVLDDDGEIYMEKRQG